MFSILKPFLNIRGPVLKDEDHIFALIDWLLKDSCVVGQGGFSAYFSPLKGWGRPYPETTGYIIPSLLNYANFYNYKKEEVLDIVIKAGDWLLKIQNKDGSFNDSNGKYAVAFDAGQILFGMVAMYKFSGRKDYLEAARRTADWLCRTQDKAGFWENNDYNNIRHAYSSRISWALLETCKIAKENLYKEKAERNLSWILSQQQPNGWFSHCGFFDEQRSVLHTIAYTIRGLLESGIILENNGLIASAKKAADVLLEMGKKDILSGFYDENWNAVEKSKCLTGLCQMGIVWQRLYEKNKDQDYIIEIQKTINFVKSTQNVLGKNSNFRGAIAGSWPVWGKYFPLSYPNWAAKFFLDLLLLNQKIKNNSDINFYRG